MDSHDVRRRWEERRGAYSPEYYAYYGPNETSDAIFRLLDRFLDRDASVLELGCSSGRHLSYLCEQGFEDLAGIELNEAAFDVMAETYPDLAADGEFYPAAIEDVVGDFEDDRFDAVYSAETLQHLHPDAAWVFGELSRITADVLVTAENEGDDSSDGDDDSSGGNADSSDGGDISSDDGSSGGDDGASGGDGPDVSHVDGDVPLYYRDWNAIFTDRGFEEVGVESGRRVTVRAFRTVPNGR